MFYGFDELERGVYLLIMGMCRSLNHLLDSGTTKIAILSRRLKGIVPTVDLRDVPVSSYSMNFSKEYYEKHKSWYLDHGFHNVFERMWKDIVCYIGTSGLFDTLVLVWIVQLKETDSE